MPKTSFDPRLHGYHFQNGAPMPPEMAIGAGIAGGLLLGIGAGAGLVFGAGIAAGGSAVGVCGGMSWSALDFFHHVKERVPGYDNQSFPNSVLVKGFRPVPGSQTLYDYIWRRQTDSMHANIGGFLLALTQPPNSGANFTRLKSLLDAGQPVPLALPGPTSWVGDGHHVVAYDYWEVGGNRDILIYDPNWPPPFQDRLLRVVANDRVEGYAATWNGTHWVASGTAELWRGFWLADGYQPQIPPSDLDDVILVGEIVAPSSADSVTPFKVVFTIANVGEFETLVDSVGLRAAGGLIGGVPVTGGRLPASHSFGAEFTINLPAGAHEIEPVYFPRKNSPARTLGNRRRVFVSQGLPKGSWLEYGTMGPGPAVSRVTGRMISGPTLINPHAVPTFEVVEYRIAVQVWVQDDLGGATFGNSITALTGALDHGALRGVKTALHGRRATFEATYLPVTGQDSTVLRITATDAYGAAISVARSVPCASQVKIVPPELNRIPDFRDVPFGRPPFTGVPGAITPLDPRIRLPRS